MQELSGTAVYIFAAGMLALGLWHFALYLRAMRKPPAKQPDEEVPAKEPELKCAEEIFPEQAMVTGVLKETLTEGTAAEEMPQLQEAAAAEAPGKAAYQGLGAADAGLIVLAGLLCVLVRTLAALLLGWPSERRMSGYPAFLMFVLVGPFVLVGATYALTRRLGGGRLAAELCALIAAASLMWDALGVPYALLALVFVCRSMDDGRSRAGNLLAAAAFIAFAAYLDASAALFAVGLWALLAVDGAVRLVRSGKPALGGFLGAALLFPLAAAVMYLVMLLPGAVISGALFGGFGPWLWLRLYGAFAGLVKLRSGIQLSADCVVCMVYGAVCAALALWAFIKERDLRALAVCAMALVSALALLFGEFRLAPLGSLLAAGYIWGRWCARGGKTQVLLGGGMLLALCVMTDVISYLAV